MEDVKVGKERLLGGKEKEPSSGDAVQTFQGERAGTAPMAVGIIERCLEDCVKYARQRHQFGKPIGDFQLIQDKLAQMYIARENVRNMVFKQIWMAKDRKRSSRAEASAVKLYCSKVAVEVALDAIQIMGGYGYMTENRLEMLMHDAKLMEIGGGTSEIQTITIAKELLKS